MKRFLPAGLFIATAALLIPSCIFTVSGKQEFFSVFGSDNGVDIIGETKSHGLYRIEPKPVPGYYAPGDDTEAQPAPQEDGSGMKYQPRLE